MPNRFTSPRTIARRLLAPACLLLALASFAAPARADKLIDILSYYKNRRAGNMGEMYLAKVVDVETKKIGRHTRKMLKVKVITRPGTPPEEFKPVTYDIRNHIRGNAPPKGKPVLMTIRVWNERASLMPMGHHGKRTYWLDRGEPGERFYDLTCKLLFPNQGQNDPDTFYKELLDLATDKDEKIANMAAHYLGSRLNVYAHRRCPEAVIDAIADYVLDEAHAAQRDTIAPFFRHTRLPQDAGLVLALLSTDSDKLAMEVRSRLGREPERAESLAAPLSDALLEPVKPQVREHLLRAAHSWAKKASPLWEPTETLVVKADTYKVSQDHQALAAQVLVRIDPDRAQNTIRDALPRIDSPAIYRFLYERRMYETIGALVDKLRPEGSTEHDETVRALLAALTRTPNLHDSAHWVAWWDDLEAKGEAGATIRRRFIPAGETERRIDTLLKTLADPDYMQRRSALEALHEIGPVANPKLEEAREHADFEVRVAAGQLIRENAKRLKPVIDKLYGRRKRNRNRR
jgi:hypothetical protein